ncbi:helix-turn-helix domain-containing protein [[Clostridium] fimetarium]|uniref:DNA-binding transcriptional regulator, XRE-family HTH domain n=1 Tax=[Clostridium] fimetarium TaxID=99656 RepID=A0A1I0PGU1_9FIRM|nr:helix-turn-helix domain-containing protein [[Clostridium] fimetarium]SEW13664.1 DNA-binding transcriptional regulator, XRE-family HTH domain [[Clostridium] fimetarium]
MKINEVIRKFRKEANLTQEQVANYLGVTAPAVNKWENGNSYPDITILSPLARVLKTNVDTLLSFNEELTDIEIKQLAGNVAELAQKEGFIKAFARGEELIKEYPNCDLLIVSIAQLLNMYIHIQGVEDAKHYEAKIIMWYELVATSADQNVVSMAIVALVNMYAARKEYEKAQKLLDKIPPLGYDKQITQAILYTNQGKTDEAYELYERMLYKDANEINSFIQLILNQLIKEADYDKAEKYANIAKQTAKLFDLGTYIENTPDLFIAIAQKDKKRSLDSLEKMASGIDSICDYMKSELYSHIKFKESSDSGMVQEMFKRGIESDKELEFLKGEVRFKSIMKSLSK